jgi:PBP1b-binding outer membrane lipoprotein LpoB
LIRRSLSITLLALILVGCPVETTQVYAKVVDRIRENPTKYLEEWMG